MRKEINRGEIRKKAECLLENLAAAYLRNICDDNEVEVRTRLDDLKNAGIDWNTDVVKSVRERYNHLTSDEIINSHIKR